MHEQMNHYVCVCVCAHTILCVCTCIYDVCILNFFSAAPPAMGLGTNLGQPTGFGSAFGNQTSLFANTGTGSLFGNTSTNPGMYFSMTMHIQFWTFIIVFLITIMITILALA